MSFQPLVIAANDPIIASPKLFILSLHHTSCLSDPLKYPCIGVTKTLCDEGCDTFIRWRSSHRVAKLSYGKDGIIIDTSPRSYQGDLWEPLTWEQNSGSSFLPSGEPIDGCPYHTSQKLFPNRLPFLGAHVMTLQGTDGSTFMTKEVQDQPHIKSGCAIDNPCAALLASSVKCVIGIGQHNNDRAFFAMVVSKEVVDHR